MKACILRAPAPVTSNPLKFADVAKPEPPAGEVLIRVSVCGVCRRLSSKCCGIARRCGAG